MSKYNSKKLQILKIKSAISEFILNTQKIVKSVEPDAEIIFPNKLPEKRKRALVKSENLSSDRNKIIITPNFKSMIYLDRNQKK